MKVLVRLNFIDRGELWKLGQYDQEYLLYDNSKILDIVEVNEQAIVTEYLYLKLSAASQRIPQFNYKEYE